jgi:hypothetical protein
MLICTLSTVHAITKRKQIKTWESKIQTKCQQFSAIYQSSNKMISEKNWIQRNRHITLNINEKGIYNEVFMAFKSVK